MIQESYTTKLFFNWFAYHVTLRLVFSASGSSSRADDQSRIKPYKDWLLINCKGKHKSTTSWTISCDHDDPKSVHRVCTMRVYLDNINDHTAFIEAHKGNVVSTKRPANMRYEELIRNGVNIDIRASLYYRRFRYKLHFRKWWDKNVRKQITLIVNDRLYDRSKKQQGYLISRYGASLYLASEEDLLIIKMSMPDLISKVTLVATLPDLSS